MQMFDFDGNGLLQLEEFVDLARVLCTLSYLHTSTGKDAAAEAMRILSDSRRIEDLLELMARGRENLLQVVPYLPDWLAADLLSERFIAECTHFFDNLDTDSNNILEPEELYPVILAMSSAHRVSLDLEQCRRFAAIFGASKEGGINKEEFGNFVRFLVIMSYLGTQDGQESVAANVAPEHAQVREQPVLEAKTHESEHLMLDLEFHKQKSERLASENEELQESVHKLKRLVRALHVQLEDQEVRLRHAEVDKRAAAQTRR